MRATLLALLLLTRCAYSVGPRATEYEIDVSTQFTADEAADVVAGAELWAQAIPELELSVRASPCTRGQGTHLCVVPNRSPMPTDGPRVVGVSMEEDSISTLFVDRISANAWEFGATADEAIRRTAAHEIGHQLGLHHVGLAPGAALMNPVFSDQAMAPMAADVAEFWSR